MWEYQSSRRFGPSPRPTSRNGFESLKTCFHRMLVKLCLSHTTKTAIQFLSLPRHLQTPPSTCGTSSPTSRLFWQTPLIRLPGTRLRLLHPGFLASTTDTTWPRRKVWDNCDVWMLMPSQRSGHPSAS